MRREFTPPLRRAIRSMILDNGPTVTVEGDVYADMHHERVNEFQAAEARGTLSIERLQYDNPSWMFELTEHMGDIAQMLKHPPKDIEVLRLELVRLGATVAGWVDAIDQIAPETTDEDEMEEGYDHDNTAARPR